MTTDEVPPYVTRITRRTVVAQGKELFDESATEIEIVDEAAGEFIVVSQQRNHVQNSIAIDPAEWPTLRDTIEMMIREVWS